ncbi:MAG TPA: DUF4136 domain-containing protein [Vicinamibacterales bacterium]|nr:DUF4136 domain-containing protein [Vicinamibacterales bacterium]
MRYAPIVLMMTGAAIMAQTPKYGVTVIADKETDFAGFKTYAWEHGWQAYDKQVDADIKAAIDRELGAVGLAKKESGPGDLIVTYATLRRVDVDLKSKPTSADGKSGLKQFDVGTLVVLLLEPGTRKELFRGRVDKPIEIDRDHVKATVDAAVADMFAKYPTRVTKR